MEDPLKAYNDVLKISGGEAVANEVPFSGGYLYNSDVDKFDNKWVWTCPSCSQQIPYEFGGGSASFEKLIYDHLKSHGYLADKIKGILDADYDYQNKIYNILYESITSEADNYPQKQQMSQADWNNDLDYMRKTFGGTNDEIEEDDGLDEDRVEIDISGDDVEIEDFDDEEIEDFDDDVEIEDFDIEDDEEESEEFADQGGDDEPEMEAEWKEIEEITEESYAREYTLEDLNNAGMEWDNSSIQQRKKIIINTHNGYTDGHDNNIVKSWNELDDHTKSIITDNWSHGLTESYASEGGMWQELTSFQEDLIDQWMDSTGSDDANYIPNDLWEELVSDLDGSYNLQIDDVQRYIDYKTGNTDSYESYANEEDGTDFDNDGDIDSKDYLEAKDRAIKKSIDEESYLNEAHGDEEGTSDGVRKGWLTRKRGGKTEEPKNGEDYWNYLNDAQRENILLRVGGYNISNDTEFSDLDSDIQDIITRRSQNDPDYLDNNNLVSRKSLKLESYASEYEDPIYEFNCSICGFNGIEENNNDLLENHYRDTHNITWDNNPQQMSNAMRYELERMNPDDTEEQMIQDWDNPTW